MIVRKTLPNYGQQLPADYGMNVIGLNEPGSSLSQGGAVSRALNQVEKMKSQIGNGNMYDCRYWICLDRKGQLFLGDSALPSGNLEAGFIWGHTRPRCRYYYEYDPKTGVIEGFRYEESERFACRISGA